MKNHFTLVELLVVVAIIAILASLLVPALARARYSATNTLCVSNVRQLTMATTHYAGDSDACYPDRGVDPEIYGGPWPWEEFRAKDRWAARVTYDGSRSPERNMLDMLGPYCPIDSGVWCCPLYQGTNYGDPETGVVGPTGGRDGTITYGLHAGIQAWNYGGWDMAKSPRKKLGQPYELGYGGNTYELKIMWSDGGMNFMNLWTPGSYRGYVGTNHAPPPGVDYNHYFSGDEWGELVCDGPSRATWSYDDGSVRSLETPMKEDAYDDYHVFTFQTIRSVYYPRD